MWFILLFYFKVEFEYTFLNSTYGNVTLALKNAKAKGSRCIYAKHFARALTDYTSNITIKREDVLFYEISDITHALFVNRNSSGGLSI